MKVGLSAVEMLLISFDLKSGRMELRRRMDAIGAGYELYVNGDCVMTSFRLAKLWYILSAGLSPESIAVVSSSPYMRSLRVDPLSYGEKEPATARDHTQPIEDDRYDRTKETVCDILPDFKVTLGDVYGTTSNDSEEAEAWEQYYADATIADTEALVVSHAS